jgi:glyoxylase-like metal-dependent hydrolase (beta-lactamase superfamily II)
MEYYREGDITVIKVGPLKPYSNNAYVIADTAAREAMLVDMPADADTEPDEGKTAASGTRVIAALSDVALKGAKVRTIVATHWHPDHWMSYDNIRAATGAPVAVYEHEIKVPAERIDQKLKDGQELRCGSARLRVIHTPGHTPGSICLLLGKLVLTGDTLFNGGPGRTAEHADLLTEIDAIVKRLHVLPDDVQVWPGHGDGTTIRVSKQEYAVYAAKSHADDLAGDVTWSGS